MESGVNSSYYDKGCEEAATDTAITINRLEQVSTGALSFVNFADFPWDTRRTSNTSTQVFLRIPSFSTYSFFWCRDES